MIFITQANCVSSVFFVAAIAVSILSVGGKVGAQVPKLSDEGKSRKAAHAFLFNEFSNGKQVSIKGNKPNQTLNEITVLTEKRTVSGEFTIELPKGSARVISLFRYIVIKGEGLDNLGGVTMVPYAPNSHLPISTQQPELYRVKVASMPIPSEDMRPIVLKIACKPGKQAAITEVGFNSQNKLSTIFDDIPYRNLGAEFPRETVDVKIDLQRELSINGHVDLEREKYCRYYAAPGNLGTGFETWAADRNFSPGRQILKFQPALVVGYSKNQPLLKEMKSKKGAADLIFFAQYNDAPRNTIQAFRDIKYAMCFNDYPEFMSIKGVGRGTPLIKHFDDAAALAAAFIKNQIEDSGRSANYWEVKNESTIKAEWDYHWQEGYDGWQLMADLHNKVADAVHKSSPETKIGGPSSAWMQVQVKDFSLYKNQLKFMDQTKGHVDFYSHHFYEDFGSVGAWERRKGKYTNYLLGRMETILDMFQAHMLETDNVKPILITECGSLQPGRGPSDYWLRIRSFSAYMHKLMKRPDQIELAVPFAFLQMPWNPKSGNVAFIPKEGKPNNAPIEDCDSTPVVHFFDLWRDFDGRRLPVDFKREFLDVTAVHRDNRIQLAITNMGGRRLSLNVGAMAGELPIKSVSQRRLYYLDGKIRYEDSVAHDNASAVPVDVEETTIVTLELEAPLKISGKPVLTQSWFAAGTAVKSSEAAKKGFKIEFEGDLNEVKRVFLRVGVQRDGGFGGRLRCDFNGAPVALGGDWADEMNKLFGTIEIEIDRGLLGKENLFRVSERDGLTFTVVQLVTQQ